MRRVVITGIGIVSSIGNSAQEVTASLREGKSGISFADDYADARAELVIYDLQGRAVITLVNERLTAGTHGYVWYGHDASGRQVSSGVYFAGLKIAGQTVQVEKVSMIK